MFSDDSCDPHFDCSVFASVGRIAAATRSAALFRQNERNTGVSILCAGYFCSRRHNELSPQRTGN